MPKIYPREKISPEKITELIEEMLSALRGAAALDFFGRMIQNHDARYCYWDGQSEDGRKWPREGRHNRSGSVDEIFPWPGGSDTRIRLIDTIIREHVDVKRLALQRRQERIGPRNLSPDEDPQQKAALWGQVMSYYDDLPRREMRTAIAQWADCAEEYGHGVLYVGWKSDEEVVGREISPENLVSLATSAAIQIAESTIAQAHAEAGGSPEETPELSNEERSIIIQSTGQMLADMVEDDDQRPHLVEMLMGYDPQMPRQEANRVAKVIRGGQSVYYHAVAPTNQMPEWRAHRPFIDVFYPATTTRLAEAEWIATTEWLSKSELNSRIDTHGYDKKWVEKVISKGPGRSLNLNGMSMESWILSNGTVRCQHDSQETRFQILHAYYRATAIGKARALYHTILHGHVLDCAGLHECCENEHGKYPFVETLQETHAETLLESRGIGEITNTYVNEIKAQRDMRCDLASITIKPPMKVPLNQAGGRIDIRPGIQIPMRSTAGMGMLEPLNLNADARGSMEVEATTMDSVNELWCRGPKVDPEIKAARRQMMVSDFLEDVRAAKVQTFALVQQYAAEEIKAAFVGGLNVGLNASREDIQGQISLELDFDVTELDQEMLQKRMQSINLLLGIDNAALVLRPPLLKALAASLLPASYKMIIANPDQQRATETADEQNVLAQIVAGTQFDEPSSYVAGSDHAARLDVMTKIFGIQLDKSGKILGMQPLGKDGGPTRAQKVLTEDQDVQSRIANRAKFHSFQLAQQENATTGKIGVEPITRP